MGKPIVLLLYGLCIGRRPQFPRCTVFHGSVATREAVAFHIMKSSDIAGRHRAKALGYSYEARSRGLSRPRRRPS